MRISDLGLGVTATSLIETNMKPQDILSVLNDEGREAIRKAGGAPVTMRDLREFNDYLGTLEATQLAAVVKGSADEKRLAARVQERMTKSLDLMEAIEKTAADIMNDFKSEREAWADGATITDSRGNVRRIDYPAKQVELLLKVVGENRQLVQSFHQDKGIQSFIRSATVNVNQGGGVSQRDLFMIVREMARELGLPLERVMEAFTNAQETVNVRRGPIDADSRRVNA